MDNIADLPIIDWEQATRLAGNNKEFAQEILSLLIRDLTNNVRDIKQLYLTHNYLEMQKQVHKLHGALCYCGLPRLKTIINKLETQLKNNIMESLPHDIDMLENEVKLLLEHYSRQT